MARESCYRTGSDALRGIVTFAPRAGATFAVDKKCPVIISREALRVTLLCRRDYLCEVEVENDSFAVGNSGVNLTALSVVADAVTTPYQAVKNSGLTKGDLAIFIGIGGIGGYGVQIARAFGAAVVALDIDQRKLDMISNFGADLTVNVEHLNPREVRKQIQEFAQSNQLSKYEWKIYETSGTTAGQRLAYGLLTFGSVLSVVGFTMDKIELRLSNLMAYDARAIGNWGCHPNYYPEVLELVGKEIDSDRTFCSNLSNESNQ